MGFAVLHCYVPPRQWWRLHERPTRIAVNPSYVRAVIPAGSSCLIVLDGARAPLRVYANLHDVLETLATAEAEGGIQS
jgi:hypothetical protein